MYDSAIKEVEKMLQDLEEYGRTEFKVKDVYEMRTENDIHGNKSAKQRCCKSANQFCPWESELESLRSTIHDLEVLMGELKFVNSAVKELMQSKTTDERGGQCRQTMDSVASYEDISSLEHFIDKMSKKIGHANIKSNQDMDAITNSILLYERMVSNLESEVVYLRDLNATTDSRYKEEILNLKEDLNMKNEFIRSLLATPGNNNVTSHETPSSFKCSKDKVTGIVRRRTSSIRFHETGVITSSDDNVNNIRAKRSHRVTSVDNLDVRQLEILNSALGISMNTK